MARPTISRDGSGNDCCRCYHEGNNVRNNAHVGQAMKLFSEKMCLLEVSGKDEQLCHRKREEV